MELHQIEKKLKMFGSEELTRNQIQAMLKELKHLKEISVQDKNEAEAKRIWCFEQVLSIQATYLNAFDLLKQGKFHDAWCSFCETEMTYHFLSRHFKIDDDVYQLKWIWDRVSKLMSLYPYKIFNSREEIIKGEQCSICGKQITHDDLCEHEVGEIYNGEQCLRVVTDLEFIASALVEQPLDKRCVIWIVNKDGTKMEYEYTALQYLIERLLTPYDNWEYERSMRYAPHEEFSDYPDTASCPCESGKKFVECHKHHKNGVLKPHIEFIL